MVLTVENLSINFPGRNGDLTAVRSVSFSVAAGETLAVVGESGCGKSVVNLALMGLLPPQATVTASRLELEGRDLRGLSERQWRGVRGASAAMVFQDPMSALNPCFTVHRQIDETLAAHAPGLSAQQRELHIVDLLAQVGIPDPRSRLRCFPHELSGGMAQRVMIAMALACEPALLIADEPTTALDVTIQGQILQLLRSLQQERNMAMILVTHDLAVAANYADRIQVMYAGEIVESGTTERLLHSPRHPYTQGLLACLPGRKSGGFRSRLANIPGAVPPLSARPDGCQLQGRCPKVAPACKSAPATTAIAGHAGSLVKCFFPEAYHA